ncbi:MAG TPA: NAD(+)/NADH kinase [Gaiellaceae bacterium]|jgi:NAD+ kinase
MRSVERAAVFTHGKPERVAPALERLRAVAQESGVELVDEADEAAHPDLAVVLGGDGTMLRALTRFLGTGVPVLGVNFGRVGFLTSIPRDELDTGVRRAFAGEYRVVELPTLDVQVNGEQRVAVNDAVVGSATLGRMIELGYEIGGEDLGTQPCDGLICATPSGSTAYNLSNGGPVLVWGLEAMVMTFVAPHSLLARPLVVGPDVELVVTNRSIDVPAIVIVDGHRAGHLGTGDDVRIHLGGQRTLLATLPEETFFRRYRAIFGPG